MCKRVLPTNTILEQPIGRLQDKVRTDLWLFAAFFTSVRPAYKLLDYFIDSNTHLALAQPGLISPISILPFSTWRYIVGFHTLLIL